MESSGPKLNSPLPNVPPLVDVKSTHTSSQPTSKPQRDVVTISQEAQEPDATATTSRSASPLQKTKEDLVTASIDHFRPIDTVENPQLATELELESEQLSNPAVLASGRAMNAYQVFSEPKGPTARLDDAARGVSDTGHGQAGAARRSESSSSRVEDSEYGRSTPEVTAEKALESTPENAAQHVASGAAAAHVAELRLDVEPEQTRSEDTAERPSITEVTEVLAGEES
jgi:hypothetical protein